MAKKTSMTVALKASDFIVMDITAKHKNHSLKYISTDKARKT